MTDLGKTHSGRGAQETRPARMDALATLPVFFKLAGKRAVLVGGTEAAAWKAELLSAAGAHVDIYTEEVSGELEEITNAPPAGSVTIHRRNWTAADLAGAHIALGAIPGEAEAERFVAAAKAHGVPVNVIDRPEYCDFSFGAIVNRSPLVVSISTDGAAPVFAQAIRSQIEALLPERFKAWAQAAKSWRKAGDRLGRTVGERRRFWDLFTQRAVAFAAQAPTEADLESLIAEAADELKSAKRGFVTLVGAGPGDPELMTLKAVRALRTADVILYDGLVTAEALSFARREAKRMLVGKTGYGPACKQTEINALMVSLAREGNRVVRLKSGDPMIFGRAGEEIGELAAAGVPFEVIPGISAMQAAAAGLEVSLSHRDLARRVQLVTGHSREGRLPEDFDWSALADPNATTAVYMAQRTLREMRDRLIEAGLAPDTPAMAVFNVSRAGEVRVPAPISHLPERLAEACAEGPCLVIIGKVLAAHMPAAAPQCVDVLERTGPVPT